MFRNGKNGVSKEGLILKGREQEIYTVMLWTNSFRRVDPSKITVLPLWMRLLFAPVYMIYFLYLCIKGVPIEINMKEKFKAKEMVR